MTYSQVDDDFDETNIPSFSAVKEEWKEKIARLREGTTGERRLADLLARCRKRSRCNLFECPICERRKLLPKWYVPAALMKSYIVGRPRTIYVDVIQIIAKGRRPLDEKKVRAIAASMKKIGQQVPITVLCKGKDVILICGWHRLEAAKRLGWDSIVCVEFCGNKSDAHQWEIAENLYRAELTVLDRAERIDTLRTFLLKDAEGGKLPPLAVGSPITPGLRGVPRHLVSRERMFADRSVSSGSPGRRKLKCANLACRTTRGRSSVSRGM
jgi:uncharacterized ParB-like nuclease family protein